LAKNICLRICSIDGQLLRLKLCKSLLQSLEVVIIVRIGSINLRSPLNPLSHQLLISVEGQHTSQDSIRAHYVVSASYVLFRSWKTINQGALLIFRLQLQLREYVIICHFLLVLYLSVNVNMSIKLFHLFR
jgi:hypothetical protein